MSKVPGLIHARHYKSPEFKLTDSIVRSRESTTLASSGNSVISPKIQFDTRSAFRNTPIIAPFTETVDARTSSLTHNQILSEIDSYEPQQPEIIPIPNLYNIPVPSHRRNRTEIPNISIRDLEASTIRQSSNVRDSSLNVSKSTNVLPRLNNNSASLFKSPTSRKTPISLSIHSPNENVKFDHYLEYLHLNTNNDAVRRSVELKSKSVTNKRARQLFQGNRIEPDKIPDVHEQVPLSLIKVDLKSSPRRKDKEREPTSLKSIVHKAFPGLKDITWDAIKEEYSPKKASDKNNEFSLKLENSSNRKTYREISNLEEGNSFKGMNSPTSNSNTPKNSGNPPKFLRQNSKSPFKTRVEKWLNEHERMLTNLAQNLSNLWEKVKNEQKMDSLLERLTDRNKLLINLFNRPQGKQADYNYDRILRRFKLIEFGPEPTFVPLRMKKKKMGITFINPDMIPKIEQVSQLIENYLTNIRKAEMKMVEDHLVKAEIRLDQIHRDKFKAMKLNGKIKEFVAAQKILDGKPRIDPFYFYQFDPVKEYQEFKDTNQYADISYINPKHIEHAKTLSEVYENWNNVISKKTGLDNINKI